MGLELSLMCITGLWGPAASMASVHQLHSPEHREMFLSCKELGMQFSKVHFPTLKKFHEPHSLPKGRWFKDLSCDPWVTGKPIQESDTVIPQSCFRGGSCWGNVFLRTFYACWNKSKHPVFFVFEGDTGTSTTVSCCQSPALEAMSPCFSLLSMSLKHRWVVSSTARRSAKLHYFSRESAKYLKARGTVFSLLKISACAFQSVSQRDSINIPWGSQCICKFLYLIIRPIDQ